MDDSSGYMLSTPTPSITLNNMDSANFTSTLSVDGALSTTHAGQYMCKADLGDESMNSTEGNLTVQSE